MNHCGRLVLNPHFGDAQQQVAPPDVPIRASPCQRYYASHDIHQISQPCYDCLYNEYSVVHPPAQLRPVFDHGARTVEDVLIGRRDINPKYTCGCVLNSEFSPQNFCAYAQCVEAAHKLNGGCERQFNALYNVDDVKDEAYLPPFSYRDLNCG